MNKDKVRKMAIKNIRGTLASIGLAGMLALTGCEKTEKFIDGEDAVSVDYTLNNDLCTAGSIYVDVKKSNGTEIHYGGGRNGTLHGQVCRDTEPNLESFCVDRPGRSVCMRAPCGEGCELAQDNFRGYIRKLDELHMKEVAEVMDELR